MYVTSEENEQQMLYCSFLLFTYCCLVLPIICIALVLRLGHAARCRSSVCIDVDMLRLAVVACCNMGWISAQHSVLCNRSVSIDWKHVLMQNTVTLNTCCDTAYLTCQLPHITTGSFQNHRQPTTGSLQSLQHLKERNKASVRWKSLAIHKLVWWHFQMGWAIGSQFVFFW